MNARYYLATLVFLCGNLAMALPLTVGQPAPEAKLEGDLGGRVSGEPWSSEEIAKLGKVISVFYVDPEEKKLNEPLEQAYEQEKLPFEKHTSSMINSMLKQKQEKFPRTTYVRDMRKTMVKAWDLQDDSVNVVIFDKSGKVLFVKKGKMSPEEISELMKLIRANL
jgi:predicted transcriptional regulator